MGILKLNGANFMASISGQICRIIDIWQLLWTSTFNNELLLFMGLSTGIQILLLIF